MIRLACATAAALMVMSAPASASAAPAVPACDDETLLAVRVPSEPGLYGVIYNPVIGLYVERRAEEHLAGATCYVRVAVDGPLAHVTYLGDDYEKNVPNPGRYVPDNADAAPGAVAEGFSGALPIETRYELDGFDATAPFDHGLGVLLPVELLDAIVVRTGGMRAERDAGTGGWVGAWTRRGANRWTGTAYVMWRPGRFAGAVTGEPADDDAIAGVRTLGYDREVGLAVGGPLVRDRAWFYVGASPRWLRTNVARVVQRRVDADADGRPDRDVEGDLVLEEIERTTTDEDATLVPMVARVDLAPAEGHRGYLVGAADLRDLGEVGVEGAPSAVWRERSASAARLVGDWTSALPTGGRADATIGWQRGSSDTAPAVAGAGELPQWQFSGAGLDATARYATESAAVRAACAPAGGDTISIERCPVESYAVGGIGSTFDVTQRRLGASAAVEQPVRLLGPHRLKAGVGVETIGAEAEAALSGGELGLPTAFQLRVTRFIELDPAGEAICGETADGALIPCTILDSATVTTRARELAGFVQDTWQPLPGLTVDAGLRLGSQRLDYADELTAPTGAAVTLSPQLAPRAGVSYDWTLVARSRAYAYWGRYYEQVPLALSDRAFGARTRFTTTCPRLDPAPGPGEATCSGRTFPGASPAVSYAIAGDLEGPYSDELLAGLELEPFRWAQLALAYQHRELGSVIEDLEAGGDLVLGNPDGARRDYDAVHLALLGRLHRLFWVRASYTFSRARGNYPGPDVGVFETTPHLTQLFDDDTLMVNADGRLPQDRTHALKVDGYFLVPIGYSHDIIVGVRARSESGTPYSALARAATGDLFLLPRGEAGRTETITTTDLHFGLRRHLAQTTDVELFIDIYNVVNAQKQVAVDQRYTTDRVLPIDGGTEEDLVFLKRSPALGDSSTGQAAAVNPRFGKALAFTEPRTLRFGLRLTF